ncbi:MAG: hexitol phosphatase HxpB [Cytophagaceae bacterium]|nr:hexitol phosphatase HxpB [Cytophagaceae bacterium]MBL0303865.1 hexitol phosphatase HxpB [Cytophagaceae bacterium]MBL0326681.1 hexitol phosphatase HxpB [Cytophagaceae bacterium]
MKEVLDKIEAVIFDMDGLLVDSEPLWHIAEKEVFAEVGLILTTEDCLKTTGVPTSGVFDYWYKKRPWLGKTKEELEELLFEKIKVLIKERAEPMPGVNEIIDFFISKGLKIGVASASPMFLIEIVLEKLQLNSKFDFYHSALLEKRNKPNPDVYWTVANKLGKPIEKCLILEDSINGVKGAVASGAITIAVPEAHFFEREEYSIAFHKVSGLPSLLEWINT